MKVLKDRYLESKKVLQNKCRLMRTDVRNVRACTLHAHHAHHVQHVLYLL